MKKIGIIGGGLAGLTSAILLSRKGMEVTLFEEKKYPFHRVCGEYISNEVIPFLKKNEIYPNDLNPVSITDFRLSSPSGKIFELPLDLGGFGISRYNLDHWLSKLAENAGVTIMHERVISCELMGETFQLETRSSEILHFDIVIGAFGKRSTLDKSLDRSFFNHRSPYVGVKYHLKTAEVDHQNIELHNFSGGYCGISKIEDDKFNLCYLSERSNLKNYGSIQEMEHEVVLKNPHLKRIFKNSQFLFDKPEVINEISFRPKEPVYNHILMSGDAAGMITPLCGNGMAMAIHSAKILSELIIENVNQGFNREKLENEFAHSWRKHFSKRLWAGRQIQQLFGAPIISELAVGFGEFFPPFTKKLMSLTHGKPFS